MYIVSVQIHLAAHTLSPSEAPSCPCGVSLRVLAQAAAGHFSQHRLCPRALECHSMFCCCFCSAPLSGSTHAAVVRVICCFLLLNLPSLQCCGSYFMCSPVGDSGCPAADIMNKSCAHPIVGHAPVSVCVPVSVPVSVSTSCEAHARLYPQEINF